MSRWTFVWCGVMIACAGFAAAATLPSGVTAKDAPNDDGGSGLVLTWSHTPSTSDPALTGFQILRRPANEGDIASITPKPLPPDARTYSDDSAAPPKRGVSNLREEGTSYVYVVRALYEGGATSDSLESKPATAHPNFFDTSKVSVLLMTWAFGAVLLYLIRQARRGKKPTIRRIAGLEAVDEAIGRATEMGRPILYCSGIGGVDEVATIAAINIFSNVTKKAGEFGTRILAPCRDPIVTQVMQSVSEQAYADIGRPDAYHAEDVHFLTQSQFAYAAAVDGEMVRERPAAVFLQGVFFAESLILAETGNSVGAIQIAGTDKESQLPFFLAACDYTLIGEELFAASAYLSGDDLLLSTIRAQDAGKAFLMAALVVGILLQAAGFDLIAQWFTAGQ
ncbi:MAG: fibronectin type III domain-containing protein [Candidatus Poribacteria bacterium]|nr:fibronectin type III domain-containing protein [Candidatus Poribacteria bacterium]